MSTMTRALCPVPPAVEPGSGERWDMFVALPQTPRTLLDVGCGEGQGLAVLRTRGCRVVGVDFDPEYIAKAASRLDEAYQFDLERDTWPLEWHGRFDVVAFLDVLEHLTNPWRVLREVRPLLAPEGVVVASIPNVRQVRILVKAILGRWDYNNGHGITNRERLRFFTHRTVTNMFREAGYAEPRFFYDSHTWHLRSVERVVNTLTFGRFADLLYNSHTVAARIEP